MKKFLHLFFTFIFAFQLMADDIVWDSPTTLSTSMVNGSEPQIVMDGSGNLVAVWIEDGYVQAKTMPVGGSWSSVTVISGDGSSNLCLKIDDSGNATALWIDDGFVKSNTLPSGGSWGTEETVSATGASQARLAVRSNGDMAAVWTRSGFIETSTKLFGGGWSIVNILSSANSDNPDIAIGNNGTAVAVWHMNSAAGHQILSSSKTMGGAWGAAKTVVQVSTAFSQNYPKVSVDHDGNADAIAFRYQVVNGEYINVALMASSLPLNAAAWTQIPTQLSLGLGIANPADLSSAIAHDDKGNVVAVWSISYNDADYFIESNMKLKGKPWTDTIQLASSPYSFVCDVATNSLNVALSAFMTFDGMNTVIQSAEAPISGINPVLFWSAPASVSAGGNNGSPKIATTFDSDTVYAAAIWLSSDGTTTSVQAATGSRDSIAPPSNLMVTQDVINYGIFDDYYNTITWDASTDPEVVGYALYRNGILLSVFVPAVFSAEDHNAVPMGSVTYGVAAIDGFGSQSEIINISYP